MLEYIFFHQSTCCLFEDFVKAAGITPVTNLADDYYSVSLTEDLNESILEKLENHYDELLDMDRKLAEQQEENSSDYNHAAGITVQLKDGRVVYASVAPELLTRVLQSISSDELNTIVCAITDAVENPDQRGLCQRGHCQQ